MGLLQGITEFIPISSSAHLELAPWIFGWDESGLIGSLAFDVFLHLGTLVALLVYFARDWLRYLRAWWASIRERRIGGDTDRKVAWLLVLATIPAAVIGFAPRGLHRRDIPRRQRRRSSGHRRLPRRRSRPALARRSAWPPHPRDRGAERSDGPDDRLQPGAGPVPGHQPVRSDAHHRPRARPDPGVRRAIQLPAGRPDHARRRRLRLAPSRDRVAYRGRVARDRRWLRGCRHLRDAGDRLPAVMAPSAVRDDLQRLSNRLRRVHRLAGFHRPLTSRDFDGRLPHAYNLAAAGTPARAWPASNGWGDGQLQETPPMKGGA